MEHNEEDIVKAKELAKELDMEIAFKLTWEKSYVPKNREMLEKETGLKNLSREEVAVNEKKIYSHMCHQLWTQPQVNWDGRLLGCCGNVSEDFGINVFEVGLKKAINSKSYKHAKKMLKGKIGIPKKMNNLPCINCAKFKRMEKMGLYIK